MLAPSQKCELLTSQVKAILLEVLSQEVGSLVGPLHLANLPLGTRPCQRPCQERQVSCNLGDITKQCPKFGKPKQLLDCYSTNLKLCCLHYLNNLVARQSPLTQEPASKPDLLNTNTSCKSFMPTLVFQQLTPFSKPDVANLHSFQNLIIMLPVS